MWLDTDAIVDPETDGSMFPEVLEGHWSSDRTGVAEAGGPEVRVICFAPKVRRKGGPRWFVTYFQGDVPGDFAALDLLTVDREADVEAFRVAFAVELAAMAKHAGREPALRWGVLYGSA